MTCPLPTYFVVLVLASTVRLFTVGATPDNGKGCGHAHVLANLTSTNRLHAQYATATKRLLGQSSPTTNDSERKGMRIHVDYQLEGIGSVAKTFITRDLVPAAVAIIESIIQVKRPVSNTLKLPRYCTLYYTAFPDYCLEMQPSPAMDQPDWSYCGHALQQNEYFDTYRTCAPHDANDPSSGFACSAQQTEGISDADFLLYVTSYETEYCHYATAYALYCSLDLDTNRPLAGSMNVCPSSLSIAAESFDHQVEIAVHELLHTLVFTETLFDKFVDDDGNTRPLDEVVQTRLEGGREVKRVVTPTVQREARDHYGCPSLEGAELEDEGGSGTAGSHWETRTLQGELMDGMAGVDILSDRHALSPLTLALLEDSGWYTVDWNKSGHLAWGKDAGCSFAQESCEDYAEQTPDQQWFCSTEGAANCTSDLKAYGVCRSNMLLNGCNVVMPYSNVDCREPDHAATSSVDWGTRHGQTSYCLQLEGPIVHTEERNGFVVHTTKGTRTGDCYSMDCSASGSYAIDILEQEIPCTAEGEAIELAEHFDQFASGIVRCPDRERVCSTLGCPDDCSAHGWCGDGQCYCHLGYTGSNCSERLCNRGSPYCDCQLVDGLDHGTCAADGAGVEFVLVSENVDEPQDTVEFEFEILQSSSSDADSEIELSLAAVLTGVNWYDIDVALEPTARIHEGEHVLNVKVTVRSNDAATVLAEVTNYVLSGSFAADLAAREVYYVDGSYLILEADRQDASASSAGDHVTLIAVVSVVGLGSIVFAVIVCQRYLSVRRRLQPRLRPIPAAPSRPHHPLAAVHYPQYSPVHL